MIISLSKPNERGARHVTLVCEGNDISTCGPVIATVLGPDVRPVRKFNTKTQQYRYLFSPAYLDMLLLAFPRATKSTGLQRRLDRINSKALESRKVDKFEIPGLWNYAEDKPAEPRGYQWLAISEVINFISGKMDGFDDFDLIEQFLENDEMGLGKTFTALAALLLFRRLEQFAKRNMKVLVVAPKNGKFVWEKQNRLWSQLDLVVIDADRQKPAEREQLMLERHDITVVNPEMLRGRTLTDTNGVESFYPNHPHLFDLTWDLAIIDEYHRFGSPTSQQTIGMLQLKSHRWLPMSGTPYMNRPEQLWPILHRCWPTIFPSYTEFVQSISVHDTNGSKRVIGYNPRYMKLLKDFVEPRSIRRRADQVEKDLPKKHEIDYPVELNREQRRIYNRIRDEFLLMLADGSERKIKHQDMRAQITRLKQACFSPELFGGSKHSAKLDELHEIVESLVASGEKAIIFSQWSKATLILQREFAHYNPIYVDGTVPGRRRIELGDVFNTNPSHHLYIGTIGANRESVSLGGATKVIFTDKDWSPFVNDQAAARSAAGGLRGLGSKVKRVDIIELFGVDTYEERIREVLADKRAWANAINERDGGQIIQHTVARNIRDLI